MKIHSHKGKALSAIAVLFLSIPMAQARVISPGENDVPNLQEVNPSEVAPPSNPNEVSPPAQGQVLSGGSSTAPAAPAVDESAAAKPNCTPTQCALKQTPGAVQPVSQKQAEFSMRRLLQRGRNLLTKERATRYAELSYLMPFYTLLESLSQESVLQRNEVVIETSADLASLYVAMRVIDRLPIIGRFSAIRKMDPGLPATEAVLEEGTGVVLEEAHPGVPPQLRSAWNPRAYQLVENEGVVSWTVREIMVKPLVAAYGILLIVEGKKIVNVNLVLHKDQIDSLRKSVGERVKTLNAELTVTE